MRALLMAALLLVSQLAAAQAWPAKPVRLIAPAASGGNPDVLARMLAAKLGDALGRPFLVENVPGAGGVVAAQMVARAPADGYVFMLGDSGSLAINVAMNPNLGYDPLKDFTLVTALAAVPTVLIVQPSVPVNSLQEFIAYARARPGQLSYGSAGSGSIHHLTQALFAARTGIDLLHVPYKGGTAMVAAVLAGEVQAGWSGIPNVVPHMRAGKLKVLCISVQHRSPSVPDVPPCSEVGVPGFDIATVIGLQGPAGVPHDIVTRLQASVASALRDKDMAERMSELGMELRENGTESYQHFVREDLERYSTAVRVAGVGHD
jgi:tripartite-type tricarboxylate transporter receptor subunit TctC